MTISDPDRELRKKRHRCTSVIAAYAMTPAVAGSMIALSIAACAPMPRPPDAADVASGDASADAFVRATLEWPNTESRANSDPWLAANHERIVRMRPRVLVLNFVNRLAPAGATRIAENVIAAVRESSRYRGYRDATAEPFLEYEIARTVDMRDAPAPAGWALNNSTLYPRRIAPNGDRWDRTNRTHNPNGYYWATDYAQFYGRAFAERYGFDDTASPGRMMDLCRLLDTGTVHEVWIVADTDVPDAEAAEVLESMPVYDAARLRLAGQFERCAGNGCFDRDVPVCERSVRIAFINHTRGVGCFMESLAHGMEGMANGDAIPYLRPYFREFAGFDLDQRYGLDFESWYACRTDDCIRWTGGSRIAFTTPLSSGMINDYVPVCGNAHFPPNARQHYDVRNPLEVQSTCEGYRRHEGHDGTDLSRGYSAANAVRYDRLAPDCTGMWIVWWRQNWPGVDNGLSDNGGRRMLNWWPFLFY